MDGGRYIEVNDVFLKKTGFQRDEVIGHTSTELGVWVDPTERLKFIEELSANGFLKNFDTKYRMHSGEVRDFLVSSEVIEIDGKQCSLNFIIDVTERKQIEKELRETKERYDYTTMVGKVGTWDWNVPTGNLVWNDETFRLLGLAPGSVVPSYELFLDLVHPDDRGFLDASVKASWYKKKPYSLDCRIVHEGDREIVCHITGRVEFDSNDQPFRMLGTIQDISDRKQMEEEEKKSREAAEKLAEEITIIAEIGRVVGSTLDIDEVYARLAVEAKKLILFDRLAVNLHSPQEEYVKVSYVAGEDFPGRKKGDVFPMKNSMCELLTRTRTGLLNYPSHIDGINHHSRDHHAPAHMRMGSLLRVPLIYRDEVIGSLHFGSKKQNLYTERDLRVAERMATQIASAIGSAKLFFEYRQAADERQRLEGRLQRAEKMEALGTLAGGVAHDLNNVLGIIVGYSEMILDGVDKSNPLRHGLENVMNGGLKAAAIVEDLLALARRGVQERTILNLNNVITDCQESPEVAKLSDHHPSVRIEPNLEPDLLNISGSSVHLEKSLYNLISNASEAMPKGGTLTIRTANQYLDRPIHGYDQIQVGDYVVLSVSDTGEGISEKDIKRIFEPFYTKKKMGRSGTGLGLAIVWGTLKDHNGYINVESEEGKGSTFTLYFPVTREEITTRVAVIPASEYASKGETILVVDDVKEQRDLAASLLTNLNYNVSSVSSGEEAVQYLMEHEVDLLVLDMIMEPGMDGLETYTHVIAISPKQKAIIVSGFSESDRVHDAQKLGAGAYVKKPYIKEKLGLAVRKELDRVA